MDGIIELLQEIARHYATDGEGWKSRAYIKAITSIKNHTGTIPKSVEEWCELPNIGKGIAAKIVEFQQKGKSSKLQELRKKSPPDSVQDFTKIPGVGNKKARAIFLEYKVKTLKALYKLYDAEKIEEDWLNRGLKILRERGEVKRIPLYQALEILEEPLVKLQALSFVHKAIPAGSIRRFKPTVKDIDVVLVVKKEIEIETAVQKICKKYGIESLGKRKCMIPVGNGRFIDLYFTHERNLGTMLLYLTGSGDWGAWIRGICKKKGLSLNQYNLTNLKTNKKVYYSKESDLLKDILGFYVPPECRERPGDLGKDVVKFEDIRGEFHIHTTKSDGKDKPSAMMKQAIKMGYSFLGLSDHIGFMPWSMSPDNYRSWVSVFRKNTSKEHFLIGAEFDISKTGKMSIDKPLAKLLDFVVMSSHQQPGQNLEERYIGTMRFFAKYPGMKILAHPINRNLSSGVMLEWGNINWIKVFKCAKETNTYLEINGAVERMDLDAELVRLAKSIGCKFVLSSDAHSTAQMFPNMQVALMIARKAQLTAEDVLNCYFK